MYSQFVYLLLMYLHSLLSTRFELKAFEVQLYKYIYMNWEFIFSSKYFAKHSLMMFGRVVWRKYIICILNSCTYLHKAFKFVEYPFWIESFRSTTILNLQKYIHEFIFSSKYFAKYSLMMLVCKSEV